MAEIRVPIDIYTMTRILRPGLGKIIVKTMDQSRHPH